MSLELEQQLAQLRLGDHICPIHEGMTEQLAVVVPCIKLGLERSERCLYVADDRSVEEAVVALEAAGVAVERERRRGALQFLNPESQHLASGKFHVGETLDFFRQAEAAALADGFAGLRVLGAMTWALSAEIQPEQLIEYEARLNEFVAKGHSFMLCHYDRPRFDAAVIHDVLRSHPVAILGDLVCPNPYYEPPELLLGGDRMATREFKRGRAEWWISRLKEVRLAEQERYRTQALSAEREELIHLLLDSTAEAIYGVDLQGDCVFANPACARLLGHGEPRQVEAKNMHRLMHHSRADRSYYPEDECPLTQALRHGEAAHLSDEIFWRIDGSRFPAECWSYPMRHGSKLIGAVVTFLDISERKTLEEQLRQSQRMEALGQLAGGIAHDFNNLLTVVLGNADLLVEDTAVGRHQREQAEIIRLAAERGAGLISRMLAFARRQPLHPVTVDINGLIRSMDGLLRRSLGAHVEMQLVLQDQLWHSIIDPAQLETAILNLAVNARDAMPGGGQLVIETENARLSPDERAIDPEAMPGDYVCITVRDTGTGMTPEVLRQAVEPFFTTKPVGKGTGLGLSMVYGFVKQSEGYIDISSELGVGTTVKLCFPRAAHEVVDKSSDQPEDGVPLERGDEVVLLVEDDDMVRAHVLSQLRTLGYRVIPVANGREALETLQQHDDVELLFTDIVMPGGLNGVALAERAMLIRPSLKVLFTSGYAENMLHQGRLLPGAHLLTKPYRVRDLAREVRRAMD